MLTVKQHDAATEIEDLENEVRALEKERDELQDMITKIRQIV